MGAAARATEGDSAIEALDFETGRQAKFVLVAAQKGWRLPAPFADRRAAMRLLRLFRI
jgi:hypothetical protein